MAEVTTLGGHRCRTYAMRLVVSCGFRSRRRVQGARALGRVLWNLRQHLVASWDGEWEQVCMEDRQRACPHPLERCYRPPTWTTTEGGICGLCAASVPWREGMHVGSRPR